MGKRRDGREAAVQFLYQRDLNPEQEADQHEQFWKLREATKGTRDFAEALISGVLQHQEDIDARIQAVASNYELKRIAAVDRNILRVALFEMIHVLEVPPVVAINEAIEIAKRFGSEDSGRFVNGVLDRIRHELPRPARVAGTK
jgi:N utilization substance protein B